MIHLVFDRPSESIKCYDADHTAWTVFKAEGDAWGHSSQNDYGHESWMPPGHFLLQAPQFFDQPIASEGYGQIPIVDIDGTSLHKLVQAGDIPSPGPEGFDDGNVVSIGGNLAKIGQLATFQREALMVHGGGSNAPEPLAPQQELCKTYGCTRMYNQDWEALAHWLAIRDENNIVVFSVYGDPVILSC